MKLVLFLLILLYSPFLLSNDISSSQYEIFEKAYKTGKPYDLSKSMVAIVYQESLAGEYSLVGDVENGFGDRSYGVAQVKLRTAKHVMSLGKCDHLDRNYSVDEKIIADLIHDESFNIEIAACYLNHLDEYTDNWRETILAYNRGLNGSRKYDEDEHPYVLSIIEHMTEEGKVKDFLSERR